MQLWVMDNRKRLSESSADLARLTGVTLDTARAWESRGAPSADAIAILERHFGRPAPTAGAPSGDTPQGVPAAYLKAVNELVEIVRVQNALLIRLLSGPGPDQVADLKQWAAEQLASTQLPLPTDPSLRAER
jgi:hypothetical protein